MASCCSVLPRAEGNWPERGCRAAGSSATAGGGPVVGGPDWVEIDVLVVVLEFVPEPEPLDWLELLELEEPHPARASTPTTARRAEREGVRLVISGDDPSRVVGQVFTAESSHRPRHVNVTITASIQRCDSAAS